MGVNYIRLMYDISRIQRAMAEQFLSARQLAKKAKVAESTVTRIFENGTGNPETIGKIVRALKLNPKDVVISVEAIGLPEPRTIKAEHELTHSARKQ
jgi:predicted transcriptional regulator